LPEEDALALEVVHRPAGRAVERRPDDLRAQILLGRPRSGHDPVSAGDCAGIDPEAVVPCRPAGEARGVCVVLETRVARRGCLGVHQGHRLGSVLRNGPTPRLRDHVVAVAKLVADDLQLGVERRRAQERDLESAAERFGEETRRVAAVRRPGRAVEAGRDDHRSSVSVMTPNGGRASV
jgi:hypothetical protein